MPSDDSSHDELYRSLEKYLASALEVLSGWGEWLAEHERRVLDSNIASLQTHADDAQALHGDLRILSERRGELLPAPGRRPYLCDAQATGASAAAVAQRSRASATRQKRRELHGQP